MGSVAFVWLLQIGAVVYFAVQGVSLGGFGDRLLRACRSRAVICLAVGCFAFLVLSIRASSNGDYAGASAASLSLYIELALLVLAFLGAMRAELSPSPPDMVFGSAKFASLGDARAAGLIGETGIRLGSWRYLDRKESRDNYGQPQAIHYTGERHLLTIAPTRAGKGVSTIIPNLLTFPGSALIIDPKGENAAITLQRRQTFGACHALDPWGITDHAGATFNPLDILTPDSPTLIEDALLIADALVVPDTGGDTQFWSEQARAFIMGYLLHIATSPDEIGHRHLGRLRDMLNADPDAYGQIGAAMKLSDNMAVAAAASRMLSQPSDTLAGIISTAQQNTHFLDSPALRANLASSSFQFADLKGAQPLSIYVVLPVDRIGTYSRWLRLLVALGIAQLARVPAQSNRPVLFMLDEFAQLGRLQVVEEAYGLMAGMGLQLHAIVQDLSQLNRLYPNSWQTFLANAGAIQVFGTRDLHTAEYFSKMLGQTTAEVHSYSRSEGSSSGTSNSSGGGGSSSGSNSGTNSSASWSRAPTARPLLFPDELMRMDRDAQLVFIENADPLLASKIVWHADPTYQALAGRTDAMLVQP